MSMIVKAALATVAVWALAGEALAQSQGPMTTLPWATRSRTKPNADQQPSDSNALIQAPTTSAPVQAAPEPPKAKIADR